MSTSKPVQAVDANSGEHANRLIAILGHELRGRLAPIASAAQLLNCERLEIATRRDIAVIVDRQVKGMTRLVDDLLEMARLRSSQPKLQRRLVAVQEVVEYALEMGRPVFTTRAHSVVVTLAPEALVIDCDELWLSQAIQNLLCNAAKYTEAGGRIVIEVRASGADAVVSVRDTGIGIAPQHLSRIFDPFVQVRADPSKSAEGGSGIGLHLVRLIVEAHGGTITATSAGHGCGSTFTLRLPTCELL